MGANDASHSGSFIVNNPTIQFPDYAYVLGVAGYYNPLEWWYASTGALDAHRDVRETGPWTALHKKDGDFQVVISDKAGVEYASVKVCISLEQVMQS